MRKTLQRTFGLLFFALVGVMTGTAQNSFPYSVDFTTAGDLAGWTAVDDSPTKGVTWEYGTGAYSQADAAPKMCAIMKEDAASKHVDYLVSPEFTATAGATYYISIKAQYKGYARCGVQVGKSATDMSANSVISENVASSFGKYGNGWFDYKGVERAKTAKVAYTATEDGPIYFSLYAHSMLDADDGDFFYVYGIDIVEDKPGPKALPYSVDLGDNQRGWAALDASDVPGVTWAEGEFYDNTSDKYFPGVVNKHDWENTWNDYYVSPAFTLEAGKSYKVKTRTWKNTDPSAFTLSLMLGTSQTDASTFQKITDLEMQAVYDATATEDHVFAVGKGGDYNLAFLATTTTGTDEVIALSYFDIAETDETPEITIGGGSEGPETTALPYNITFDSADKFATWSTLDNSDVPGKTWEFNASDFAGKPSAFMGPDAGSATCDWLISPKFELKEGKSYVIKFDGATGADNKLSLLLDYFVEEINKDNTKGIGWIGEKLPKMEGEEAKTEWTVDINKDGGYYFAFRALNWTPNQETDAISIYSFSVAEAPEGEPETPVALPYETSFLEETGAAGWTAMDRSDNVSSTWSWNSWGYTEYDENWQQVGETHPCVGFSSDWDTNANDYFVSPLFTLEAGKTYVVKTHTATNRSCFNDKTTSFTMKLGTNKKVQGTFTQSIGDIELNTVYDRDPSVFEFTVEESGNYYVAYNISDPVGSKAYGYIFDFSIAEKVVPDVTAELPYEITFDSADKFATWSTLDNSDVPGKTWEFNASDFAGKPSAFMGPDAGSATCDWLISPKFELKEGKSYVIKFDGATGADNKLSLLLDYFEGSKDKDNFKNITWIGEKLPKMEGEEAKTEWTVDINKDGSYYFAFRALNHTPNQETDAISIYSFSVTEAPEGEPETPVALPYETSFLEETGAAGWTAMDRSDNVSSTWSWNSWGYTEYDENWQQVGETHPCVGFSSDWDTNANDYFVSPLFTLEAGKTYVVKTHTATNRSCFNDKTTSFTMKLGTNKKVQGTFTQSIGDIELNTVYDRDPSVFEFKVEENGNYYVAYHISDPDGKKAYGYIFDFSIAEKVVPDVTAELPYEITFDSADKFATWSTLDNSDVPGKTWEFNASDFAGKPSAFMGPDAGSATCDWLISPKFELKEGKSYVIKFDGATGADNATSVILDYFVGSKDKDNFKTITWVGEKLPKMEGEEAKTEWTVDINKDGSYYFAFRALNHTPNQETDAISIYSFSVTEAPEGEPETPVALPYETSFLEETGAAGWTAMDRSDNVSSTWSWNSWGYDEYDENWQPVGENHPCVGFSSDWGTNANDYFVSPLFTLEAGKTYVVKTHTATNRSCFNDKTTSFTMKLGTNKKVQGTFTQSIGDIELNTVYDRDPSVFEFSVEESGNYYVAYHISDPDGKKAYGYIFDFSLAEKTAEVQPVATTPVTDLAATEAGDLKTIKLKWKNPTKDVDGNDLAADAELSVKVFEGETLLTTVAGAPGAEGSYSYEPETYAGLHEYKVVVVYNELESEAATATLTVVVNGINGAIVIPAGAEVSVRTLGGALVGNNFSTLAKGTYLVTVKTVDGKVKTMKVTK
ncbi:choice-of-anchor J domain-containing protein [Prevotella sp. LMAG:51]|uniref:choice-of-anchor J domain-containing protein n=5 Tax=Prevotella TaxID=838 RepID=UPI00257F997A|nr:choice-of-anchor J domain-containing protein [Prevotella sp. LMAG:51]